MAAAQSVVTKYSELKWFDVRSGKLSVASRYKGFLYSEKMDGWFVYWDGHSLFTKSGRRKFDVPASHLCALPLNTHVVGELVLPGRHSSAVSKLLRRTGPWNEARLYAFDLPRCALPFETRTEKLKEVVARQQRGARQKKFLHYIPQKIITTDRKFLQDFLKIINRGGEGLVLTDPDSFYTERAARVKLKAVQDAEAVVVGYSHAPASLLVRFQRERFRLGVGLSNQQRRNLRKHFPLRSLVKFSYRYIGPTGRPIEARLIGRRMKDDMRYSTNRVV